MQASKAVGVAMLLMAAVAANGKSPQGTALDTAKASYEKGDYAKVVEILRAAENKEPNNGDIQLLLTKAYLELNQYDAAVSSGEKAVAINPKSSVYHQWLGEAYGGKADHVSMFSAYGFARKTQKEFATAVELDEHNYDAAQDLVEYDCTAPGVVGGGEDKAQPIIQKLISLDAAQGHYAAGNCKAAKKDYAAADVEILKALQSKLKSIELIFNIADYFAQRSQAEHVEQAAELAEAASAGDLRVKFYRAVGWILQGAKLPDAEKLLKEYLQASPGGDNYPRPFDTHFWLGQLYEKQKNSSAARTEYQTALKLNPKFKRAQDALKKLGN